VIPALVAGTIVRYTVNEGAEVKKGQTVLILNSMKMELEIKSTVAGKIRFLVPVGTQVAAQQPLAEIYGGAASAPASAQPENEKTARKKKAQKQPENKTTAQKAQKTQKTQKAPEEGHPWLITVIFILCGAVFGAFVADALWLRILLGVAGALVAGIVGVLFSICIDTQYRFQAIILNGYPLVGAAIGAYLGQTLWQRALFGLAGAFVLAVAGCLALFLNDEKKKGGPACRDLAAWTVMLACYAGSAVFGVSIVNALWLKILLGVAGVLVPVLLTRLIWYIFDDVVLAGGNLAVMTVITLVCVLGGGAAGAFIPEVLWQRILLGLAGALVLGFTGGCYCAVSSDAADSRKAIIIDILAVAGAALGAFWGRVLWQRAVFGLAGALALTIVGAIITSIIPSGKNEKTGKGNAAPSGGGAADASAPAKKSSRGSSQKTGKGGGNMSSKVCRGCKYNSTDSTNTCLWHNSPCDEAFLKCNGRQ
jgi:biotin carboxyl carrier protein